jgi:acylglycerol kinase
MKEIDLNDTDVIVVAGGNATVNEVISGLIHRTDSVEFLKRIPIGVIPIGESNTFAHKWLSTLPVGSKRTDESEFRLLADSAMAIVRGETAPADLIKVSLSHSSDYHTEENYEDTHGTDYKKRGAYSLLKENQIYALSNVSCGFVTAVDANMDTYWYFGWLKTYMNNYFTRRLLVRQPLKYTFQYKLKCFGCSKCLDSEALKRGEFLLFFLLVLF